MSQKGVIWSFIVVLFAAGFARAAVTLEDFESYSLLDPNDILGTWAERNPAVATIELTDQEAYDGNQSMKYTYRCGTSPYWSEAFTIFPEAQDWSNYKTLNIWVKGKDVSQAKENMYLVLYTAPDVNVIDHSNLSMLGKTRFYEVSKIPYWVNLRADITFNFEPLTRVRAIGFGMSPTSYGGGVMHIDALSLEEKGYGGLINDFEDYADANDLLASGDILVPANPNQTMLEIESSNPENIYSGGKSLKISYNNGLEPYFAKVAFNRPLRFNPNWSPTATGANYNPLTIHFKVEEPEGNVRVALINSAGNNAAVYYYPDPNSLQEPTGWIRWDIDPTTVYDYNDPEEMFDELDYIKRVEVQFTSGNYGQGVVYLDDLFINVCGKGVDGVGDLDADLNKDCVVDMEDIAMFARQWMKTNCTAANQYCGGADFSLYGVRNGKVDLADLAEVVSEWLDCNMFYQGDCFVE
jgi:hypothetical protein